MWSNCASQQDYGCKEHAAAAVEHHYVMRCGASDMGTPTSMTAFSLLEPEQA